METPPDRPLISPELMEFAVQCDRLLRGAMGDESISAQELATLRKIGSDPTTMLGREIQRLRREIEAMAQARPEEYGGLWKELLEADARRADEGQKSSSKP